MRQRGSLFKGSFVTRVVSALFLAPLALLAVYAGSPFLEGLVILAVGLMAWEWSGLCGGGAVGLPGVALSAFLVVSMVIAGLGYPEAAVAVVAVGALVVIVIIRWMHRRPDRAADFVAGKAFDRPQWLAAGAPYIGLPCIALIWLGGDETMGYKTVFWMFALVWAVDTGGYIFGNVIGGARLAPAISPNKTWAGLLGGTAAAGVAGAVTAMLLGKGTVVPLALLSAALGVVSQGGDLAESWVKRHFGVKDTSNLIPGHGGVLDRVDGLLVVLLVVAAIDVVSGRSILIWI